MSVRSSALKGDINIAAATPLPATLPIRKYTWPAWPGMRSPFHGCVEGAAFYVAESPTAAIAGRCA